MSKSRPSIKLTKNIDENRHAGPLDGIMVNRDAVIPQTLLA